MGFKILKWKLCENTPNKFMAQNKRVFYLAVFPLNTANDLILTIIIFSNNAVAASFNEYLLAVTCYINMYFFLNHFECVIPNLY